MFIVRNAYFVASGILERKRNLWRTHDMKLIDLTCSKCRATLQVNQDLRKCMCQYCGNEMLIDDEIVHHRLDNGFDFGYQAELGRIQAQKEQDVKRQEELKRQEEIRTQQAKIADRYRLLNIPRTQAIWSTMNTGYKRNLSDIEIEPYIRKLLQTDKLLMQQYQNGIHYSQQQMTERQLPVDYNILFVISIVTAVFSGFPY